MVIWEASVRCSCGKEGTIHVPRREMPYCAECFEHVLVRLLRKEVGDGPVRLKQTTGFYADALQRLCKLASREIVWSEDGAVAGCAETAAGATMHFLLGYAPVQEHHLPVSITREELQRFMSLEAPQLDTLTQELTAFDNEYPGTIASITKWHTRQAR